MGNLFFRKQLAISSFTDCRSFFSGNMHWLHCHLLWRTTYANEYRAQPTGDVFSTLKEMRGIRDMAFGVDADDDGVSGLFT